MKRDQSGLGSLGIIIAIVVCGLILTIGWLMLDNYQTKSTSKPKTTTKFSTPEKVNQLTLLDSKIPDGWAATINEAMHISLDNQTTKCFVDVSFTTKLTESNSADIDQNKQTIDSITYKGYTVKEMPKVSLKISTTEGDKLMGGQALDISGNNNPMSQNYAYIFGSKSFGKIQLSCPNFNDLSTAQKALQAIQLKVPKQVNQR